MEMMGDEKEKWMQNDKESGDRELKSEYDRWMMSYKIVWEQILM